MLEDRAIDAEESSPSASGEGGRVAGTAALSSKSKAAIRATCGAAKEVPVFEYKVFVLSFALKI